MKNRGFTLIEVMIVLALFGAIVAFGVPRLFKKDNNIKAVARNFVVMSREIRNKARLTNSTYRIAVNMEANEEKYWIERANGFQTVDLQAAEKEKEKEDQKAEDAPPPLFKVDKSVKEKKLPTGLRVSSVETINMKAPQTTGTAYVYFFPEGFVEAAAVQISNDKVTWTLVFNPLTGQADIIEKAQSLKDIQR